MFATNRSLHDLREVRRRTSRHSRINIHDADEIEFWCQLLRCTAGELVHAVRAVGLDPIDVEVYLERR